MKKILALALAAVMVMALCGVAFASNDPSTATDETITVNNALIGEDYAIYKMLGATVDGNGAISYKAPIPSQLSDVLEVTSVTDTNGTYEVLGKKSGVTDEELFAALKQYITDANLSPVEEQNDITATPVVFSGLTPGYYLITSSVGDKFIVTSTTDAQRQVYEKNTTTVTIAKDGGHDYSIGDTVTYTVTFNGINYLGEGQNAKIITDFKVIDTLPEFLENATVTSVTVGGNEIISTLNVSGFDTDKYFMIPWADGDHANGWTSKYAYGVEIVITYTATLTNIVKIDGDNGDGNLNTVEIQPVTDENGTPTPHEENWKDDHEIFTYGAALKKVDDQGNELTGAKFQFLGLTVHADTSNSDGDAVYIVDSYDPASSDYGTEVEVDANGMLYIIGLAQAVDLTGIETVAPDGFNKLTSTFTLEPQVMNSTIWTSSGTRYYDADGNLVASSSTSSSNTTVTKNVNDLEPAALQIVNMPGTELPSTGGIGTTIFYVSGLIMVLGASIILISRRRADAK